MPKKLSEENIAKLHLNGVYECEPVLEWLPSYKRDTPYHCMNWVFTVQVSKDKKEYYMRDTYFAADANYIPLTDENFDKFEFLFDRDEVDRISPEQGFYDYDEKDRWHIAMDSGGLRYSKYYYVRKGAVKNKKYQLENLQSKLKNLEWELNHTQEEINRVKKEIEGLDGC